ncbi:MAG: carboxy-S-adenosyl-L-methionine synthase CmoA [Gammaproteobacteria bacterium]|nr:carboxy-S-adenosyl-L-methionine synthase CmoA [Gammaproteobacteria bacterium]
MKDRTHQDQVYATPKSMIVDFAFDETVAKVFPDMIRRSVPGYETIIALTGLLAEQYAQPDSQCYDLGCSLGAATLAMRSRIQQPGCRIIAVDNAEAMTSRCQQHIQEAGEGIEVDVICGDIQDVIIEKASVVVINFTLQFIEPTARRALLEKIYTGLRPGGALLLSEKIAFLSEAEQERMDALHMAFKKANGYSDLEISQKRSALENILIPDTLEQHYNRLQAVGFSSIDNWFRCINFVSILAVK